MTLKGFSFAFLFRVEHKNDEVNELREEWSRFV